MNDHELFVKAVGYATLKHEGQKRLDGRPYITHPIEVANSLTDPKQKIVAVLHDVLEDTDAIYSELKEEFGGNIAYYVLLLSKTESMDYEYYINIIKNSNSPLVTAVKIADLKHNLSTIDNIEYEEKRNRLKARYEKALEVLQS